MMAKLLTILGTAAPEPEQDREARLVAEWQSLLAAATSPAERDEINDFFGQAVA